MRFRVPLAAVSVAGAAVLFASAPAAAQLGCPDHMSPTPAAFVNNGEKKDKNPKDGVVCAKPAPECAPDASCPGGPDREMTELYGAPLLGVDGVWYWVTDNTL